MLDERTGKALQTRDERNCVMNEIEEPKVACFQRCSAQASTLCHPEVNRRRTIGSIAMLVTFIFLSACTDYVAQIDDRHGDPIMFGLVFSNKHIAKPFIEHLLGIKIDHLETPIPEAVLSIDAEHKGVRYDVYARETNENGETIRSFDLEMQMVDTKELPQRARYYQSVGDGVSLSKGGFYTSLKEQYIIFLCPMDIFGRGFPVNDQVSFYKADTLIRNKYMTYEFDLHESKEEVEKEAKLEMVDAMLANPKFTDEDISAISGVLLEEIEKRRAQRQK